MKTCKINISEINIFKSRLDGNYHLSDAQIVKKMIAASPWPLTTIGKVSNRIWHPTRWKRVYVGNPSSGVTLLGSAAMLKSDLSGEKLVSKKYTEDLQDKLLNSDWILISCSGTIGNCVFTNNQYLGKLASQHIIRINPKNIIKGGFIYAYLSSKFGYVMLTQGTAGSVIQHIEPEYVEAIEIPNFPLDFQEKIDRMIKEASQLRDKASQMLKDAEKIFKQKSNLEDLKPEDYNYFGTHSFNRKITSYKKNISEIGSITFNAFNHSEKIEKIKQRISNSVKLSEILLGNTTFSTGSFPRVEVKAPNGVMLINQTDAFDNIIKGKNISLRKVNLTNLVEYGEVIVAGVGTLGENESFCRTLFANEDFEGQLISGEFIRMKTNDKVPSGYLFTWLNSDYGFRFIRHIHTGTKLCRPIPKLFLEIPIPILKKEEMDEIDRLVKAAHTKRHKANKLELEAISLVECEIEKWTKE